MTAAAGHVVIVGAGQAGVTCAEALRSGGFAGAITLLGDEPHGPYHRPPLSKAWLAGEIGEAQLVLRSPDVLARKQITLRTAAPVRAIDRLARTLTLADGEVLGWTGLVLATGSRARRLPLPGLDAGSGAAANVLALRSRDEASAVAAGLERCLSQQRPLVVIGGGFIGLEVAATARKKGLAVTVLEAAPRLLGRVLPPDMSDWYAALHRRHGVEVVLNARIAGVDTEPGAPDQVSALVMADGTRYPCGLVVLGVGVEANDGLAREAGLETDRGIVVDACGRTADPAIVAAGDCTARRLADGSLLRLESVQNATEQAKSAAAALLGQERPFTATPWFWSDQYDCKLQMAGLSAGVDRSVVRGDMAAVGQPFSVWHFRAQQLVAVDTINAAGVHLLARKLLDAGRSPTPEQLPEQLADPGFDPASLLKAG